ncbi:anhydro-N-acetylmuramic acid kinase [Striga asiatica]|uniref:Anhydro-N-acetylmuramic acid kinase n=1 Tax=Striga asiatica TaxID=4170 RepID=A0A5A7P100_STRAF|nr:anhydro-N-acetylmuramic acid kinase [Striga asiatica]
MQMKSSNESMRERMYFPFYKGGRERGRIKIGRVKLTVTNPGAEGESAFHKHPQKSHNRSSRYRKSHVLEEKLVYPIVHDLHERGRILSVYLREAELDQLHLETRVHHDCYCQCKARALPVLVEILLHQLRESADERVLAGGRACQLELNLPRLVKKREKISSLEQRFQEIAKSLDFLPVLASGSIFVVGIGRTQAGEHILQLTRSHEHFISRVPTSLVIDRQSFRAAHLKLLLQLHEPLLPRLHVLHAVPHFLHNPTLGIKNRVDNRAQGASQTVADQKLPVEHERILNRKQSPYIVDSSITQRLARGHRVAEGGVGIRVRLHDHVQKLPVNLPVSIDELTSYEDVACGIGRGPEVESEADSARHALDHFENALLLLEISRDTVSLYSVEANYVETRLEVLSKGDESRVLDNVERVIVHYNHFRNLVPATVSVEGDVRDASCPIASLLGRVGREDGGAHFGRGAVWCVLCVLVVVIAEDSGARALGYVALEVASASYFVASAVRERLLALLAAGSSAAGTDCFDGEVFPDDGFLFAAFGGGLLLDVVLGNDFDEVVVLNWMVQDLGLELHFRV